MSIAAMKKVALLGAARDKSRALEELQELGCMHVVPLAPEETAPDELYSSADKRVREALRHLLGAKLKRLQVDYEQDFSILAVTDQALENRRRKREIQERIDALHDRIKQVEPWGNFELPTLEDLGDYRLWFYVVPHYQLRRITTDRPWQIVHRDSRHSYVVALSKDLPPETSIPVTRSKLGVRSLAELRHALSRAETEMEDVRAERWALTRFITLMIRNLARAEDAAALVKASRGALDAEEIFAVSGWVPKTDMDRVIAFADAEGLACTFHDPGPDDDPPVLLDNPSSMQPGEDLVTFYQIPGYGDWDPSPVIYISFAWFFGMIVADAVYGAVIGLMTVFFWKRMARTAALRRTRKLLTLIAVACITYGVLVGSYLGVTPKPDSALARLHVLDINDFTSMMRLSIGVGVVHLIIANAVTAWGRRRSWTAFAAIGWIFVISGGFTAYLGVVEPGITAGIIGLVLVMLFSSARPINKATDVLRRFVDGVLALTNVTQAFGDILSYLRLFALGLASASLAVTFNQLGADIMGAGRGIALLLGLLVLSLGHGLNFILAIVSGVVHGLRLNVIELYNWSVFGEGTPFQAFEKREATVVAESPVPQSGGGL
ncbi:MAG: V-type ATPase 116kDa subunit family protein [Acidobacteriota bacterium]|nr:MAG: V-type ATPase 116kDa subunit family protein [Acidobacteriota bacterium]